jgi:hypothetical protein
MGRKGENDRQQLGRLMGRDYPYPDRAPRLDGRPFGQPKGEYRPHVNGVDIIAYVQEHGHGPNGPRDLSVRPYDTFDGPLPGQTFEEWKQTIQGSYYKPPPA